MFAPFSSYLGVVTVVFLLLLFLVIFFILFWLFFHRTLLGCRYVI